MLLINEIALMAINVTYLKNLCYYGEMVDYAAIDIAEDLI